MMYNLSGITHGQRSTLTDMIPGTVKECVSVLPEEIVGTIFIMIRKPSGSMQNERRRNIVRYNAF